MTNKSRKRIRNFLLLTVGSFVYAVGIACFLDPNRLIPGGVSGLSIMISHLVEWLNTGTLIFVLNIPLLVAGLIKFGYKFMLSTVYVTALSSAIIDLISGILGDKLPFTDDLLLAAIAGGALMALGLGLVLRGGGTTGGTDIVTKFLRLKFKHVKTGNIFLMVDSLVILTSAIVFKDIEGALYAVFSLVISTRVLDLVLYGGDSAKLVYIISDNADDIAEGLTQQLNLGVTFLDGQGAYTGKDKKVLMCAAHRRSFPKIRALVSEKDNMAFMIVSSAQEIFGEGFKNYRANDL